MGLSPRGGPAALLSGRGGRAPSHELRTPPPRFRGDPGVVACSTRPQAIFRTATTPGSGQGRGAKRALTRSVPGGVPPRQARPKFPAEPLRGCLALGTCGGGPVRPQQAHRQLPARPALVEARDVLHAADAPPDPV